MCGKTCGVDCVAVRVVGGLAGQRHNVWQDMWQEVFNRVLYARKTAGVNQVILIYKINKSL